MKYSGLKKKQHHSENEDEDDDEQPTKASEPKRRAQTFAKPQEESTGMHDIKSMFAANKTRSIHRQEQVCQFLFHSSKKSSLLLESKR